MCAAVIDVERGCAAPEAGLAEAHESHKRQCKAVAFQFIHVLSSIEVALSSLVAIMNIVHCNLGLSVEED